VSATVQPIDFLPAKYREVRSLHADRLWQCTAIGAFLVSLAVASSFQIASRQSAKNAIEDLGDKHSHAIALRARLNQLQKELATHTNEAALRAYLRHRWPLSQVLTAVFRSVPESIVLKEFKLVRNDPAGRSRTNVPVARGGKTAAPKAEAKLQAAESDLAVLREVCDAAPLAVELSGTTTHTGDLYRYITAIANSDLVAHAEITSIESAGGAAQADPTRLAEFKARVDLRPGYGQPNGPKPAAQALYTTADKRGQAPSDQVGERGYAGGALGASPVLFEILTGGPL
jgi:hypothetical protein